MKTNKWSLVVSVLFGLLMLLGVIAMPIAAKSQLDPGDIAIIGYNFDNPDEFAFVALVKIDSGTTISFTDNGWFAAGGFRFGEGTSTWTASTDIATGTIVAPAIGSMQFSTSGDQILAYQGSDANPSFIYALNSDSSDWAADAIDSNTSALPTGLTNGTTAVAIPEVDNGVYTGTTMADAPHNAAYFLPLIGDPANWDTDNGTRFTMPSGSFTGPNAVTLSSLTAHAAAPWAGIALAGLLLGALVLVRRKR